VTSPVDTHVEPVIYHPLAVAEAAAAAVAAVAVAVEASFR